MGVSSFLPPERLPRGLLVGLLAQAGDETVLITFMMRSPEELACIPFVPICRFLPRKIFAAESARPLGVRAPFETLCSRHFSWHIASKKILLLALFVGWSL